MKFGKSFLVCMLFAFVLVSQLSAEVLFSGKLETQGSLTIPYVEKNSSAFLTLGSSLSGTLDAYEGNGSLHVEGSISYDLPSSLSLSERLETISGKENLALKCKEAYLDYYGSFWGFRVGRQIVSWGAADSFVLTNILCPDDKTAISASDVSESKLGIDGIKFSFNTDSFLVDAYWIPVYKPSALPLSSSNPLRSYLIPSSVETDMGALRVKEFSAENLEVPTRDLSNSEYGIRLSGYTSLLDYSIYGFYGYEDTPVVFYQLETPASIVLKGEYKRMTMVGVDTSIPVGGCTLRFESAFYPKRYFGTSASSQLLAQASSMLLVPEEQHHELSFLGGVDYMRGNWTLSSQYYGDYVFGEMKNLDRENFVQKGSLSVSYDLLDGDLSLSLASLMDFHAFDSVLTGSASCRLSDELTLELSAIAFLPGPKEKGEYGAMTDLSHVSLKGTYRF